MLEHAFRGSKRYWIWLAILSLVILTGFYFYLRQFGYGLGLTGMSRNVSWGLYIAQFTFIVGVAASAVMVVLPYYLHDYKAFGKITILGEFLAISSVMMCMLFVFVDLGQPFRVLNIFLYPTFHSLMFWDVVALSGYLVLNVIITRMTLGAEYKSIAPPKWIRPVILLSIPWAISIHTVTAFLFAGLAGRPFWLTAILAPRFLASAFSGGPALLVVLCLILKKLTRFDPGDEAIKKLGLIITYAMCANVFFILMEFFTTFYSGIPEDVAHMQYLYFGIDGNARLVPWMWTSAVLAIAGLVLLITPKTRNNHKTLFVTCIMVFLSIWIDKGLGLVITGFIPSPFGKVIQYWPTIPESFISLGIWGVGLFLITVFYKIALSVRRELEI
ncbi:MAG TPA: polysulfide reductase NrfD [Candidatus Kryptobacter bacterium]|nr:polysulfide reductase NrfD [Candidatus Kryptobacter bacterium]